MKTKQKAIIVKTKSVIKESKANENDEIRAREMHFTKLFQLQDRLIALQAEMIKVQDLISIILLSESIK